MTFEQTYANCLALSLSPFPCIFRAPYECSTRPYTLLQRRVNVKNVALAFPSPRGGLNSKCKQKLSYEFSIIFGKKNEGGKGSGRGKAWKNVSRRKSCHFSLLTLCIGFPLLRLGDMAEPFLETFLTRLERGLKCPNFRCFSCAVTSWTCTDNRMTILTS